MNNQPNNTGQERTADIKTIQQIKDGQAIVLGYNSFKDLYLNPKQDMDFQHLQWCVEKSMEEYAAQFQSTTPIIADQTNKTDADTMFNALWAIMSDVKVDTVEKCMDVAGSAINSLIDKTRNDTPQPTTLLKKIHP
jgi:hypothetical protein